MTTMVNEFVYISKLINEYFIDTLIINGIYVLKSIACICLLICVGRPTILVTTSLVARVAGFAIYFVKSSTQILVVASIFSAALTAANIVLNSVVVDILPIH